MASSYVEKLPFLPDYKKNKPAQVVTI